LKQTGLKEVNWLIGGDSVSRLPTWHDFPHLIEEVHFVVMLRPGTDILWDTIDTSLKHLRQNVVPAPLIDISASGIRERVRQGKPIDYHVPAKVAQYIHARRLYQEPVTQDRH
jgi:nicotinate-nucleotide adenylyltransferase